MKINIVSIPHLQQRYPTCGDWWLEDDGSIEIRVSQEMPENSRRLVALHELAEIFMCLANGVSQKEVDDYDMKFEESRKRFDNKAEAGDNIFAPYFKQHSLATAIEQIACAQMGLEWRKHGEAVEALDDL